MTNSRSEDADSGTKEVDSRRKVFERNRPASSSYLSRYNNEDSKDTKGSEESKDRVESKTNEDNTKKDEVGYFCFMKYLRRLPTVFNTCQCFKLKAI